LQPHHTGSRFAAKKGFIFTTLIEHAEKNIYIVVLFKN